MPKITAAKGLSSGLELSKYLNMLQRSRQGLGEESEPLKTKAEKHVRKITRFVESLVQNTDKPGKNAAQKILEAPFINDVNGESGLPGVDASPRSSREKTPPKQENAFRTALEDALPRFGPCYGADTGAMVALKKEAWQQVLNKASKEDQSSVPNLYRNAIKGVEQKARDSYDSAIVKHLKPNAFRNMMLMDGCLFLQLVLYILGCSDRLGYPETHPYFGKGRKENARKWIKAMFYVGNQIPCVVLNELMKQSFFQMVIQNRPWILPSELHEKALYLTVVHPALQQAGSGSSQLIYPKRGGEIGLSYNLKDPCDLLHCLHTLILGVGNDPLDPIEWEAEEDLDLDLDLDIDLESGIEELDRKNRFPSASEIRQSGIRIRKADGGIRKIYFMKKFLLLGYLYVPPFSFDMDTELMLRNLKNYEVGQQQCKGNVKREVAAYLRFMRDLIQTHKDVSLLESRGIVKIKKEDHKDKLPGMLNKIISPDEVSFTQNLRLTRLKVTEYRNPPCYLISWALIFTLVQTVFTILQYFQPRN